jgi:magnesium transporter
MESGESKNRYPHSPIEQKEPEPETTFYVLYYDASGFREEEIELKNLNIPKDEKGVTWINIPAPLNPSLLETIGEKFQLHPLLLEDLLFGQRPKLDDYGDYIFLLSHLLEFNPDSNEVDDHQIGIVMGSHYVLSFSDKYGHLFKPIREKIKKGSKRIRSQGADYLTYSLVDHLLNHSFLVLESIEDRFDMLEKKLIEKPDPHLLVEIEWSKRQTATLRRSIVPMREAIHRLRLLDSDLITPDTRVFLNDIYDHVIQSIEMIESFRESSSGMLEVHLLNLNQRMNDIMKVLTLVATIFVPLTFFATVFGMNFEYMPELKLRWAYPAFWGLIVLVSGGMITYFYKKGWLSS